MEILPECLDHLAGQPADFISLADFSLIVGSGSEGRRLPVHTAILSQHSAWFRSLFASLKEGLASQESLHQMPDVGSLSAFSAFLRCLYNITATRVREELVVVRQDEGEVLFDYHVEELLALAHQFDVPALFSLIEEVASEEPSCRLALLMDPLRWLLVCDEYQHLGLLGKVRSTAVSFLTAKFGALQSDARLERLSAPTLCEVVRMAGHRLATLSGSCGHVQAVQDRAVQRFTATAQQVASHYCPDSAQAGSYVTHWWLNPSTNCIKLSWSRMKDADADAEQDAGAAAVDAAVVAVMEAAAAAAAAEPAPQQQQQQPALAQLPAPQQQPAPAQLVAPPVPAPHDAAGWAQAAALQQALGHVAAMQQHQHLQMQQLLAAAAPAPGWDPEDQMSDDELAAPGEQDLEPLLQALYLPHPADPPASAAAAAAVAAVHPAHAAPAALAAGVAGVPFQLPPGAHPLLARGALALQQLQHGVQQQQQQRRHQHHAVEHKARFHPY